MDESPRPHGWHGSDSIYDDNGCEVSPKCTECPLPNGCKHDDPEGYQKWRKHQEDLAVLKVMKKERLSVEEAAERFSVTVRTIFRIQERVRDYLSGQRDASLPGSTAGSAPSGTKTP